MHNGTLNSRCYRYQLYSWQNMNYFPRFFSIHLSLHTSNDQWYCCYFLVQSAELKWGALFMMLQMPKLERLCDPASGRQQREIGDWLYNNPRTIKIRTHTQQPQGQQSAPGAAGNGHAEGGVHPGRLVGGVTASSSTDARLGTGNNSWVTCVFQRCIVWGATPVGSSDARLATGNNSE